MKLEGRIGIYMIGLVITGIEHDKIFAADFKLSDLGEISNPDEQSDIKIEHVSDPMKDHEQLVNRFSRVISKIKQLIEIVASAPEETSPNNTLKNSAKRARKIHKRAEHIVDTYRKICAIQPSQEEKLDTLKTTTKSSIVVNLSRKDWIRSKINEIEEEVGLMSGSKTPTIHHATIKEVIESTFAAVKEIIIRDLIS